MYYIKLPDLLITFLKQFFFMYVSLWIVQRKNVKKFSHKQTAIQASILSAGILLAKDILDRIENDFEPVQKSVERFDTNTKNTMVNSLGNIPNKVMSVPNKMMNTSKNMMNKNEDMIVTSKNEANQKSKEEISVNQLNDFNQRFDNYVASQQVKPPAPDFEEQKQELNKQANEIIPYINKYSHYNTTPGYTYVDPKAWRVPTPQPPICLTNTPCTVNPVMVATSIGNEFLPYSYVKSSTELQNVEKATV